MDTYRSRIFTPCYGAHCRAVIIFLCAVLSLFLPSAAFPLTLISSAASNGETSMAAWGIVPDPAGGFWTAGGYGIDVVASNHFILHYDSSFVLKSSTPYNYDNFKDWAIAKSPDGNVVVSGEMPGYNIVLAKYDPALVLISSTTFDGCQSGTSERGYAVKADAVGNIWASGMSCPPGYGGRAWIAKYSPSLALQSHVFLNGLGVYPGMAFGIAVDPSGGTLVTGSDPTGKFFIARYDSSLVLRSSTTFSSAAGSWGHDITVDPGGTIWITGGAKDASIMRDDIWVAKYSPSLVLQASATVSGTINDDDYGSGIAVDHTGAVWVTGMVYNSGGERQNIWVGKFNSDLVLKDSATANGPSGENDFGRSIAIDSNGDILVAGALAYASVTNTTRYWVGKYAGSGPDVPPGEVTSLTAVPVSTTGAVNLTWSAPGGDGGGGALGPGSAFYVQYSMSPSVSWSTAAAQIYISTTVAVPGAVLTYALEGLSGNTTYYFRLWTKDAGGNYSSPSNEAAAVTGMETPVNVRLGEVSATAIGVSSIVWTWSGVLYADSYRVISSTSGNLSGDLAPEILSWTETALSANAAYTRSLAAFNGSGTVVSAAVTRYTLAAPPSTFTAGSVFVTSASVNWALGVNPVATRAEVYRSTDNSVFSAVFAGQVLSFFDTGLSACTTYYFRARNLNGDGLPTAYGALAQLLTGNSTPQPPSGLSAEALPGNRIALSWVPSPSTDIIQYRLYSDAGSGTMNYSAPAAVLPSTASAYTTGVLVSSPAYTFALRAVNRCGVEEANTRVLASASSVASHTNLQAAIREPHSGKRIKGNSVTVIAELVRGYEFRAGGVLFQYKPSASAVWVNIPANHNHPNPDLRAPYFVHWDVTGLLSGNYDLRAVAFDLYGQSDPSAPAITVTVDSVDPDICENDSGGGNIKKEQVISNTIDSVVQSGDAEQAWVTKVSVPASAVEADTVTLSIVNNPLGAPEQALAFNPVGQAAEVLLSNGQHQLANGRTAGIILTYPDENGDGIVDGTPIRAERLEIYSWDPVAGAWLDDLNCSVDKDRRQVIGNTPHFSYFAVFAPMAATLSAVRAYPNPWKPGSGGRFDAAGVTFDNLTSDARIRIYTIAGELVRELRVTPADSGVKVWDGRNSSGSRAASGIYLVLIRAGGKDKTLKLGVER